MIKYHCNNPYNPYSGQIYPLYLRKIEYVDLISAKYPDGCAQIACDTVDGYWVSSLLKCYVSKKGKYVKFGGTRIYLGTPSQPFELVDVPPSLRHIMTDLKR